MRRKKLKKRKYKISFIEIFSYGRMLALLTFIFINDINLKSKAKEFQLKFDGKSVFSKVTKENVNKSIVNFINLLKNIEL